MTCRAAVRPVLTFSERFRRVAKSHVLDAGEAQLCDEALARVEDYLTWRQSHPEEPYEAWPGRSHR